MKGDIMSVKFLSAKELAQRWGFKTERPIYAMKDRGEIPYTMIGGNLRFPLDEIVEYEQTHTMRPEEEGITT